ncbi:hypothetical protein A6U95_10370 [Serratia sp. 14-2641]|nr:hypothetical protein A6U95_10370 [Serratia sp. 14-2641]
MDGGYGKGGLSIPDLWLATGGHGMKEAQLWRKAKVMGRCFVRCSDQWATFPSKLGCSAQIVMEGRERQEGIMVRARSTPAQ